MTMVPAVARKPLLRRLSDSPRWQMFAASPLAVASVVWLVFIVLVAIFGPMLVARQANFQQLLLRFYPPFSLEHGIAFVLGGDSLGRPILLQLIVGAQTSMV